MVKIIKISKDGKIVLPKEVRKEIGLRGEENYVLVADDGNIVLKRVEENKNKQKMQELLDDFSAAFKTMKITKKDIQKEIKLARKGK